MSPEACEIWQIWHSLTDGGRILYIARADFNATPEQLHPSGLLSALRGVIVASGHPTCKSGEGWELDYFVVHEDIAKLCKVSRPDWAVPFGPHAAVWLKIAGRPHDMFKLAVRHLPKKLPLVPTDQPFDHQGWQLSKEQAKEWVTIELGKQEK